MVPGGFAGLEAGPGATLRRRMLLDPADSAAIADALRETAGARATFRLFRRLAVTGAGIDDDVLRLAIEASKVVDGPTLSRFANAERLDHPLNVGFVAAALLVHGRIDIAKISATPQIFDRMRDNLDRAVALLADRTLPSTRRQAFDVMTGKQQICAVLRRAGYLGQADRMDLNLTDYLRRTRQTLYGRRLRGFTEQWTFAIGHMVLLAYMARGQAAGLLDFDAIRVWEGARANSYLWERVLRLSTDVEVVPRGTVFAENHSSRIKEWVDGRYVDVFEACGIVADRAGDARGAILDPPPDSPALARFRDAAGLPADARIVTLDCRETGYRGDYRSDLRNIDVAGYLPALRGLVDRGYRVVRLGHAAMSPLPPIEGVYDYARSPLKCEELDVLLPGIARFHVGSSSGLSLVPLLFGVPCLYLNWFPFDVLPWGRRSWTVLKPIESLHDGRRIIERDRCLETGHLRGETLLRCFGYRAVDLRPSEVERAVLLFADAVEAAGREPAKVGRNAGRLLVFDDAGEPLDLACNPTGSPS